MNQPWLLDTNLLVALLWPAHEFHEAAQIWFAKNQRAGWATCPLTQSGFVRVISNPTFSRDAVSPAEASERLSVNLGSARHRFISASIPFAEAVAPFADRLRGHQQVTDVYLLGLAVHHGIRLATFDRALSALAGGEHRAVLSILENS